MGKQYKKLFILGIGLTLWVTNLFAQPPDTLWTKIYDLNPFYGDEASSVQQTSDGGYIIAGSTHMYGGDNPSDVLLIKTDANGDTLWTRTYGGADQDWGKSVQQTTDGGYIIVGYTDNMNIGSNHVYLIKTDAYGDTLWTKNYGTGAERGHSVQQTSDGGYVIAGHTGSSGSNLLVYLIKTDAEGNTIWTRTYGEVNHSWGNAVRQTSDGGYVVTGVTGYWAGGGDFYLVKTDANGDTLWTRTYGGDGYDEGASVQQTSDGGYVIVGSTMSFGGWVDVYLIKTDANGDTLWTRTYGGTNIDRGSSVQETFDGGYIIVGTKDASSYSEQIYLIKTSASGDTIWTKTYNPSGSGRGSSVRQILDGGYIVAGACDWYYEPDICLIKLSTEYDHEVGVVSILAPSGVIRLDTTVTPRAVIANRGKIQENFSVVLNIGSIYSDTKTITLLPGELDTVAFIQWRANQRGTFFTSCSTMLAGDECPKDDIKKDTVTVGVAGGVNIYSISPYQGGNIGSVTVDITGSGFQQGAKVKLTRTEQLDIVVDTSAATIIDSTKITTTFYLKQKQLGAWNVVVTNPSGDSAVFYSGFTIEVGYERLWVDIVGRNQVGTYHTETYRVWFGNKGNTDTYDALILVTLPNGYHIVTNLYHPIIPNVDWNEIPDGVATNEGTKIPVWLPKIPVGYVGCFQFTLGPFGSTDTTLSLRVEILSQTHESAFSQSGGRKEYVGSSPIFQATVDATWEAWQEYYNQKMGQFGFKGASVTRNDIWNALYKAFCEFLDHLLELYDLKSFVIDALVIVFGLAMIPVVSGVLHIIGMYELGKFLLYTAYALNVVAMKSQDLKQLNISVLYSVDPNDKAGPAGFGEAKYVSPYEQFQYNIYFENVDTATAAAQEVVIKDTLNANLNWNTFAFGDLQIRDSLISVANAGQSLNRTFHLNDTVDVDIQGNFNPASGITQLDIKGIDRRTGELADFLSPNKTPPEGEGWVSFTVSPKQNLTSGTRIENLGWVTFDNKTWACPMDTNPIFNTIDALPPSSSISPLAKEQYSTNFEIQISGADDEQGSGIRNFDIYFSDNDSAYTLWKATDSTRVVFTGVNNHTYKFYSIARDNVGYAETAPSQPDAVTTIKLPTGVEVSPNPFVPSRGHTVISFFGAGVPGAEIKVFNKAGELVQTLKETKNEERLDWDAKSENGKNLASGVYIYVAKEKAGTVSKGKFGIIR